MQFHKPRIPPRRAWYESDTEEPAPQEQLIARDSFQAEGRVIRCRILAHYAPTFRRHDLCGAGFEYLKIRYKLPDAESSTRFTRAVTAADAFETVDAAARDVRFAAAVAAFGELLRGGRHTGEYGYEDVASLAQGARGEDPFGYRNEFVRLVRLAQSIAALEQ